MRFSHYDLRWEGGENCRKSTRNRLGRLRVDESSEHCRSLCGRVCWRLCCKRYIIVCAVAIRHSTGEMIQLIPPTSTVSFCHFLYQAVMERMSKLFTKKCNVCKSERTDGCKNEKNDECNRADDSINDKIEFLPAPLAHYCCCCALKVGWSKVMPLLLLIHQNLSKKCAHVRSVDMSTVHGPNPWAPQHTFHPCL